MPLRLKRVYDDPADSDGTRVLVDRLWPRGLSKASAHVDLWLKEIAPSDSLRKWFAHDPAKWPEFSRRYAKELASHPDELRQLRSLARRGPVTLLYAAKDDAPQQRRRPPRASLPQQAASPLPLTPFGRLTCEPRRPLQP